MFNILITLEIFYLFIIPTFFSWSCFMALYLLGRGLNIIKKSDFFLAFLNQVVALVGLREEK